MPSPPTRRSNVAGQQPTRTGDNVQALPGEVEQRYLDTVFEQPDVVGDHQLVPGQCELGGCDRPAGHAGDPLDPLERPDFVEAAQRPDVEQHRSESAARERDRAGRASGRILGCSREQLIEVDHVLELLLPFTSVLPRASSCKRTSITATAAVLASVLRS